ncbi:hypothetical protein B9Z55_029153 [Caenorhabditis nigoni]|uniref:Uncharacterized protein n=1 Tax=Caenorhabditis nigoni TaxID=1611254 RepID=A0A2G5S8K2_9PELO|nr:hypothetical protein B9Z55_029153 [Caenorhabditis nigoni]
MSGFGVSDLLRSDSDGARGTSGNENGIPDQDGQRDSGSLVTQKLPNKTLLFRLNTEIGSVSREWILDDKTDFLFKSSITEDGKLLNFGRSTDWWRFEEEITGASKIDVQITGGLNLRHSFLTERKPYLHLKICDECLTISSQSGDSSHSFGMVFPLSSSSEGLGIFITVTSAEREENSSAPSPAVPPTNVAVVPSPAAPSTSSGNVSNLLYHLTDFTMNSLMPLSQPLFPLFPRSSSTLFPAISEGSIDVEEVQNGASFVTDVGSVRPIDGPIVDQEEEKDDEIIDIETVTPTNSRAPSPNVPILHVAIPSTPRPISESPKNLPILHVISPPTPQPAPSSPQPIFPDNASASPQPVPARPESPEIDIDANQRDGINMKEDDTDDSDPSFEPRRKKTRPTRRVVNQQLPTNGVNLGSDSERKRKRVRTEAQKLARKGNNKKNWCENFHPHCISLGEDSNYMIQCVNCAKWWHNFCLYLNREKNDDDFRCCGERISQEVPEAKSGRTKQRWEQMQKDAQKK